MQALPQSGAARIPAHHCPSSRAAESPKPSSRTLPSRLNLLAERLSCAPGLRLREIRRGGTGMLGRPNPFASGRLGVGSTRITGSHRQVFVDGVVNGESPCPQGLIVTGNTGKDTVSELVGSPAVWVEWPRSNNRGPRRLGVPNERSMLAGVRGQVFVAGVIKSSFLEAGPEFKQ
jgi:hypothetical protein